MKDLDKVLYASSRVSDLCIDEETDTDSYVYHHLPVLDKDDDPLDPDNWDLDEKKTKEVEKDLKILEKYAESTKKSILAGKEIEPLPPWVVFPHYPSDSTAWRSGIAEEYMAIYIDYIRKINAEEFSGYDEQYPQPGYVDKNMFSWNLLKHPVKA